MRSLVAGGAGFIGSHLVDRLLAEGHEVDVVDDLSTGALSNLADARGARTGRLKIHQVDVCSDDVTDLVEQRRPEVVYVLVGAEGAGDAVGGAEIRVMGGLRLLEGARRSGTRKVVVAAGGELYGPVGAATRARREGETDDVHHPDAAPVVALLTFLRAYREVHDIEFALLVLSSVYGPRQRAGLVAQLVEDVLVDRASQMSDDGYDLVFVDDVVDAFVRAADRGSGLVVNVATGTRCAASDVRAAIVEAVAAGAVLASRSTGSPERPGGVAKPVVLDPGRARIQLGWSSWTELDDGLRQTLT